MPVPLEDYTVRENGIFSYDTLTAVAKKYGTTAAALKYFNRNEPYAAEINKLSTGDDIVYVGMANKIDPAKVPTIKVPVRPQGSGTTNPTAGSVSTTTYTPFISKRIILKRINASYGTAIWDNIFSKTPAWEYIHSKEVQPYHYWDPIFSMLRDIFAPLNALTSSSTQAQIDAAQAQAASEYKRHTSHFAKMFRVETTDAGRISRLPVTNTRNPTQTPPDSDVDKKKVLAIIEKINDLNAPEDSYGHWWLEIYWSDINLPSATVNDAYQYTSVAATNLRASYGFWPMQGAGAFKGAITGSVPGGINNKRGLDAAGNAVSIFDINNTDHQYDPYTDKVEGSISWKVNKAFFATDPYGRDEDTIYNDIIEYIGNYPRDRQWAWPDTDETQEHCQSFQKELLAACGLVAAPEIPQSQFPPLDKYKQFWGVEN